MSEGEGKRSVSVQRRLRADDAAFLKLVAEWITTFGEVLVYTLGDCGDNRYLLCSSLIDFEDHARKLERGVEVRVYGRPGLLPLRGVLDEEFAEKALALAVRPDEALLLCLDRSEDVMCQYNEQRVAYTRDELIEVFRDEELMGKQVAFGRDPDYDETSSGVVTGVVGRAVSTKAIVGWTAIPAVLGFCLLVGVAGVPTWKTRSAIEEVQAELNGTPSLKSMGCTVSDLGGAEEAARKGPLYLASPKASAIERARAVTILRACGSSAIPHLTALLGDEDHYVRLQAVLVLGDMNQPAVSAALIDALADSNYHVCREAARALGEMQSPPVGALLAIAQNRGDKRRCWAAEILGRVKHEGAMETLIGMLRDDYEGARYSAARALGDLGDPRAIPHLAGLQGDKEKLVRQAAAEALRKIRQEPKN